MEKIKKDFHDIINILNKITVKSGLLVELAKGVDIDSMNIEELRLKYKKALDILASAEKEALEAGQSIERLKKELYIRLK